MAIDYKRFQRVMDRCKEVGTDPKSPTIVGLVYKSKAEGPIMAYLEAEKAVTAALSAYTKERREGLEALEKIDGPYRAARSVAAAMVPDRRLPDTLKSEPTDTDQVRAVEGLLDAVDDHVGTPWADELLAGPFGQLAPQVVKEVYESISANKDLAKAITNRAAAYGPAYEAYLPFKRVVRETLGPASLQYRRIHLRASPKKPTDEAEAPDSEPTPPTGAAAGTPAATPTNNAAPVTPTPADPGQSPA